jgi:hypothetical protein
MRKLLVLAICLLIVFSCSEYRSIPYTGLPLVEDSLNLLTNRAEIESEIHSIYEDTGVLISILVDHMVDLDEARSVIRERATRTSYPDDMLLIVYFDSGITYEYYFAQGAGVNLPALKEIFQEEASSYEEVGGKVVLLNTLEAIHERMLMYEG